MILKTFPKNLFKLNFVRTGWCLKLTVAVRKTPRQGPEISFENKNNILNFKSFFEINVFLRKTLRVHK